MKLDFIPSAVQIEICSRCSLSCPLCPSGCGKVERQKRNISLDFFKEVMDEVCKNDPRIQLWNYGETLQHPEIIKILNSIPSSLTRCELATNGQIMSDSIANAILSSGITEIIFAIDGLTQETYEKYRCGGSLSKALNNLKTLITKKAELKSKTKITVQFIALKHNFHEIPLLGDFFLPMDVDEIRVKSVMLMVEGKNEDILKVARNYLYFNYPGERYIVNDNCLIMKGKKLDHCPLLGKSVTITTDERILPCCWDYNGKYEIVDSSSINYLKETINSDRPPKMCQKCPIRYQQPFSWQWNNVPGVNYNE